jgi:2',3'-cyclic-nucleotide 2'-phosphodiesterase (5'-nucleotidase family)
MLPHHADTLMLERGGIKIGVVGATLETTPLLSNSAPLKFAATLETVSAASRALKQQGADITVAVVHADKATGQKLMVARAADIILSGHNHDLHIDFDGRVALTESGEDANYVVAMDVDVTVKVDGAARSVTWWPNYRIFDTRTVTPDPAMLLRVRDYEKMLSQELDVEIGVLGAPLDSATRLVRGGETAIGNLFADALRAQADAEITIMNGGGIRGNRQYAAGHRLTRRDILTELPFGNKTVLTNVTGAQVRAAIENGLSMPGAGRFLQVSGLVINASLTAPVGSRVISIEIDGKPLDPARIYKLATLDFMLRGGDGYTSLRDPAATEDNGDRLAANDVMAHARKLGEVSARVEGRIILQ